MDLTFPNESGDYRAARRELLDAEAALREHVERVARMRRSLPLGGAVPEDYRFSTPDCDDRALSSLFGRHDTLLVYSFMYAPGAEQPCPACTSLMDGWNGRSHATPRSHLAALEPP